MIRFFTVMSGLVLVLATILGLTASRLAGLSFALGGVVCIVPSSIFALILFKRQGARQAKQIVAAFYRGEAIKMAVTVMLFVIIFKTVTIAAWAFFAGFILAQMVYWLAPLLITK